MGRGELIVADLGVVDYQRALALQNAMVAARTRDEIGDTLLMLEHPHVYTLGRGGDERFITAMRPDVPTYRVSRGGQVTYHGPGQLVGYAILKLEGADRDVTRYLRTMEAAMIDALGACGIAAGRREKFTGVWAGARKIASIGVGIRRWVTFHGFALNIAPDLSYFDSIVPCGIENCEMTSITRLGRSDVDIAQFSAIMRNSFAAAYGFDSARSGDIAMLWRLVDPAETIAEARN